MDKLTILNCYLMIPQIWILSFDCYNIPVQRICFMMSYGYQISTDFFEFFDRFFLKFDLLVFVESKFFKKNHDQTEWKRHFRENLSVISSVWSVVLRGLSPCQWWGIMWLRCLACRVYLRTKGNCWWRSFWGDCLNVGGLCLAKHLFWVPTSLNPADSLSRHPSFRRRAMEDGVRKVDAIAMDFSLLRFVGSVFVWTPPHTSELGRAPPSPAVRRGG